MKLTPVLSLFLLSLLSSCSGQTPADTPGKSSNMGIGDTVDALGSSIMVVYQDKKNNYWFGSWETGVYRYDGKTLINYSDRHGLPGNRIDEIQEDDAGNLYFTACSPNSAIARYEGNFFTVLPASPTNNWQLNSTDMWFRHAYQNEKVYRFDGTTLHELQLPKPPHLINPF